MGMCTRTHSAQSQVFEVAPTRPPHSQQRINGGSAVRSQTPVLQAARWQGSRSSGQIHMVAGPSRWCTTI